MKKTLTLIVLFFTLSGVFAQKKKKDDYHLSPSFPITVDGDIDEWAGKLNAMDTDSTWSFGLTNDQEFLYLAVKVKNQQLQQEVVRFGIVCNVNPEGKKKDGAMLIFPVPDSETLRALSHDDNYANLNLREELIKRSRGYRVKGFRRIVDGLLSYDNTYGVSAIARLDGDNQLVYEAKLPIEAIGIKDKNDVAIQVLLNNRYLLLNKAIRNRQRQARSSVYQRNSTPSVKDPFKVKTDVWIVGPLNKN